MKKDVIYIDNDDEITSIIDKVQSAKNNIVALVLPKRCTVLQSSVNMKILKKSSLDAGKKAVLITSESALLPIAGSAGLFVAKTLQSKPFIPEDVIGEEAVDKIQENQTDNEAAKESSPDENKSIGELDDNSKKSKESSKKSSKSENEDDKPIEIGDDPEDEKAKKQKEAKKTKDGKKLKIPNFNKFRLKLILAITGVIVLIGAWVLAFIVLPKASIAVELQYTSVPVKFTATAIPNATEANEQDMTLPAKVQTLEDTDTKQFEATGQKNNGNKASGIVRLTNCNPTGKAITVPAGTTVTSDGLSFATQESVTLDFSTVPLGSGECKDISIPGLGDTSANVKVIATEGGDKYNLSGDRSYSVSVANVTAYASDGMGGGTNKIVTVISQSDCDNAKNELLGSATDDAQSTLSKQLEEEGYTAISDSFNKSNSNASCSPNVGDESTQSTATVTFNFAITGVKTDDLNKFIENYVAKQDDQENQKVYDSGIDEGIFTISKVNDDGSITFQYEGVAKTAIEQDADRIAQSVTGQKYGNTVETIKSNPGVVNVEVNYSPFWVKNTPKSTKHITVTFTIPDDSQ
jgi:hypothetical protein